MNIANGNYNGTNNTGITIDRSMTIIGESQDGTIINGTNTYQLFTINSGISLILGNLTLTGGSASNGGAITNNGNLTINNCTLTLNNALMYGGAIYNYGTFTLTDVSFTGNHADRDGGGIFNDWGNCNLTGASFTGNTAGWWGGAIYNVGIFNVHFSRFYNNTIGSGNTIYSYSLMDATDNWWGSNDNPSSQFQFNVIFTPWLKLVMSADPDHTSYGGPSQINASFNWATDGTHDTPLVPANGHIPDGTPVRFSTTLGSITTFPVETFNGLASATLTANNGVGVASVSGLIDNYQIPFPQNSNTPYVNVTIGATNITVTNATGYWHQTVPIIATLTDTYGNPINNADIIFTIDTYSTTLQTNTQGIATLNYPITLNPGIYTILVQYNGNTTYLGNTTSGILNVTKTPTNLTVGNATGFWNQTKDIVANLTDYQGHPLNNKTISFTVGSDPTTYNVKTGSNGLATLPYVIIQNVGTYAIHAVFAGDDEYIASFTSQNGTLNVTSTPSNVNVLAVHNYAGQNVTLTANIVDYYGQPITGGQVRFTVGSTVLTPVSVIGGIATIPNWTIPLSWTLGNYNILAEYNGSTQYLNSSGNNNLTVDKTPTNLTVGNATGYWHQYVNILANLTDYYGNPLNKTVTFNIEGDATPHNATTVNGIATLNYQIIQNVGIYAIQVIFAGDTKYLDSVTSPNGTLTVTKIPTNITVSNASGAIGRLVNLTATLTDTNGNPLYNKTVEFQVNGTSIGNATTNALGIVTLSYKVTEATGSYNLTAIFAGDSGYLPVSCNGTLTTHVAQASLYLTTTSNNNNPTVGSTVQYTIKVGNHGTDAAYDVIMTYIIPDGLVFVSATVDMGNWTYNSATRTLTWNLGTVPVGDPYIWFNLYFARAGSYLVNPVLWTSTYDPTLNNNTQNITVTAVNAQSGAEGTSRTIGMQNTGIPIAGLVLAILALFGGLIPKRK